MKRDGIPNTFIVAILLCLVCSLAVSGAASFLKKAQDENVENYRKQNVLSAADLLPRGGMSTEDVNRMYDEYVITRIIEIPSGKDVTEEYSDQEPYDQEKASEDKKQSNILGTEVDIAGLKRMEKRSYVYMIKRSPSDETIDKYVFPIRGKGLWSMMKGFISVSSDMQRIRGLSYYDQGETPGLGGEVENPAWKAKWKNVKLFDESGNVGARVVKGISLNEYQVDGLSGATITSNGVTNMIQFWLGDQAFGQFIAQQAGKSNTKTAAGKTPGNQTANKSQTGDNHG